MPKQLTFKLNDTDEVVEEEFDYNLPEHEWLSGREWLDIIDNKQ